MRHVLPGTVRLLASLALLLLAGCNKSELPSAPWLLTEDFGAGIHLNQDAMVAGEVAAGLENITTWILTADEFAGTSPHTERSEQQDLLVAKYFDVPVGLPEPGLEYDVLIEIKLFLARPADSVLTLQGAPLAQLEPAELTALLGEPFNTTDSPDGLRHMTFYYALSDDREQALRVISTHNLIDMSLKDFAIALVPNPEQ